MRDRLSLKYSRILAPKSCSYWDNCINIFTKNPVKCLLLRSNAWSANQAPIPPPPPPTHYCRQIAVKNGVVVTMFCFYFYAFTTASHFPTTPFHTQCAPWTQVFQIHIHGLLMKLRRPRCVCDCVCLLGGWHIYGWSCQNLSNTSSNTSSSTEHSVEEEVYVYVYIAVWSGIPPNIMHLIVF